MRDSNNQLITEIFRGNIESVRKCLLAGTSPDIREVFKTPSLGIAGLFFRINDEEWQKQARTALMIATQEGHLNIVALLLAYGADPNISTSSGDTAVFEAISVGRSDILRVLVNNGADPNLASSFSTNTPLMEAAIKGDVELIQELVVSGGEVNIVNDSGGTALMFAAANGHYGATKVFIEHRADLNIKDEDGHTAYWWARESKITDVIDLLLSSGTI